MNSGRKETMIDSQNDDNVDDWNEMKCFDSPVKNIYSMNDEEYQQTIPQIDDNESNDILKEPMDDLLLEKTGNGGDSEESQFSQIDGNSSF